jgi:hypothetical protein
MPEATTGCPGAALSHGCIYAATKSHGAILDNGVDVDPKGGGQDARGNDRMSGNGVAISGIAVKAASTE